jgi:hypothetical protein
MAKVFTKDTNGTLTTSLVAYWKLDEESGTRADYFSTHDLALGTEPGYVAGKIGNAAAFTAASSEYLTAGNDSAFDNPTDFSVSFWIKGSGRTTNDGILSKEATNDYGAGYFVRLFANNHGTYPGKLIVGLLSANGATYKYRIGNTTTLTDNAWHYVLIVVNSAEFTSGTSTGIHIYIDGGADEGITGGASGALGSMANTGNFLLGRDGDDGYYSNNSIDEFGFWTKILSAQEVTDLYNGGSGQTMKETFVDKTFTTDGAIILRPTQTFTSDGIIFATNTKTFTTDGIVVQPVSVVQSTGVTPTNTEITNLRFSCDDIVNGTNKVGIPLAGTNYSFWKSFYLNANIPPSGSITNVKFYTDGSVFGGGVNAVGNTASAYTQATGAVADTGDQLTTSSYPALAGTPVDIDTFLIGAPLSVPGSISYPSTGRITDWVVLQANVPSSATPNAQSVETFYFQYDQT